MAIVEGQIEPLKKLKNILNQNGITRFNSIGEINDFKKNYESEKSEILKLIENTLDAEINNLQSDLIKRQQIYDDLKADINNEINNEINSLSEKLKLVREKSNKSLINRIFFYPRTRILINNKSKLEKNLEKFIHKKTHSAEQEVIKIKNILDDYTKNSGAIISERCMQPYKELASTKEVVEGLYTLIAGAVGENLVVKEVQKLSDNFYLFNDFSIEFNPPIYNRKENDRIFSIQIDHLLVCESGIFILETKNWSKKSIKNIDLRSPVKQILRTSYALFVLLNSESKYNKIKLDCHHWGNKQIPIRNIIVMINEKPKEVFKHVKVLSLNELNGYVTYFDPIFNSAEIESICNYLRM